MDPKLTRRSLLQGMGGIAALSFAGWPTRAALASAHADTPRLVVVTLRGGMDGLAVVPALGDPDYARARGGLALAPPGSEGGALALDGFFGLHPLLPRLHERHRAGELLVVHATALPYRDRSHFDAQNLLESGGTRPFARADGWLGRALAEATRAGERSALALHPTVPLVLRGPRGATSWAPTSLAPPDAALLAGAAELYRDRDPELARSLSAGRRAARLVADEPAARRVRASFPALARAAGTFLSHPEGPRVAVLELGGWDSHNLQGLRQGTLGRSLTRLDAGLEALRQRLGRHWSRTVVVATTEFGRTVAMNGSGGTDHGTAGCALLVGGAVAGGRVLCDWPGLAARSLHEGRDLRPTRDLRSVWKGVLRDHLGLAETALARRIFPDSAAAPAEDGLIAAG